MDDQNKSFLELLPSKTAFAVGFVSAILCMGTLGFVILGSCVLNKNCGAIAVAADTAPAPIPVAGNTGGAVAAPSDTVPSGMIPAVTDKDHIRGDKDAEVTIIEYSDFECPFCGRFHPTMQQVMADYDGKVRWVYRHFPLSFHPQARPAAEASECASEQGKFWEYGDALVENQASLGEAVYQQIAKDLGLNLTKFNDCLKSDRTLAIIDADEQGGAAAGVTGTPGSFVIGKDGSAQAIKGALPYASVKAMVDAALK